MLGFFFPPSVICLYLASHLISLTSAKMFAVSWLWVGWVSCYVEWHWWQPRQAFIRADVFCISHSLMSWKNVFTPMHEMLVEIEDLRFKVYYCGYLEQHGWRCPWLLRSTTPSSKQSRCWEQQKEKEKLQTCMAWGEILLAVCCY